MLVLVVLRAFTSWDASRISRMFAVLGVVVDFHLGTHRGVFMFSRPAHLARKSGGEVARLGKLETSSEGCPREKQRAAARPNSGLCSKAPCVRACFLLALISEHEALELEGLCAGSIRQQRPKLSWLHGCCIGISHSTLLMLPASGHTLSSFSCGSRLNYSEPH